MLSSLKGRAAALAACGSSRAKAGQGHCVVGLGKGVVWVCGPGAEARAEAAPLAASVLQAAEETRAAGPPAEGLGAAVEEAFLEADMDDVDRCDLAAPSAVNFLVPEAMASLENCRWRGDGHFNYSKYVQKAPPTLGQLVAFLRMVEVSAENATVTVHFSSEEHRAEGAVLAGAVMVLLRGMTAKSAWAKIKRCSPRTGGPSRAWDRFPLPFSKAAVTTASSLTVLDCLAGLEAARDLGWFKYDTFDIAAWRNLRRKFDATWVIPGEILALGEPSTTSMNPAYPGLLDAGGARLGADCSEGVAAWCPDAEAGPCEDQGTAASSEDPPDEVPVASLPSISTAASDTDSPPTFVGLLALSGIRRVVRLNKKRESGALREGVDHEAIFRGAGVEIMPYEFEDGSEPPSALAKAFVNATKEYGCPIAVHCMQGLGRTGAMTGAYAVARHNISGEAFLGWVRMCRPGSIQTARQERFLRKYKK